MTVDLTPNGRGDCVVDSNDLLREIDGNGGGRAVFVKPEERRMKFQSFVDELLMKKSSDDGCVGPEYTSSSTRGVPYLSHQVQQVLLSNGRCKMGAWGRQKEQNADALKSSSCAS